MFSFFLKKKSINFGSQRDEVFLDELNNYQLQVEVLWVMIVLW